MAQQQRTPVEQPIPSHLPSPWPDPQAYNDLYREVNPYQDYSENQGNWQEIRISPGNSAEQVYRRLPSDLDRVLGGYLTRTRICYAGDPHRVWVPGSKACTFQSHRTRIQRGSEPDLPSLSGIRWFLMKKCRRHVTVGRFKFWVWEKTPATLDKVRELWLWECDNMVPTQRQLREKAAEDWQVEYSRIALRHVGVDVPADSRRWNRIWPRMLETKLALKVEIYDRDA